MKANAGEHDTSLFQMVSGRGAAIGPIVSDWIDAYYSQDGSVAAMKDLISFVLKSAGCSIPIDVQAIEDQDSITDTLEELQHQLDAVHN